MDSGELWTRWSVRVAMALYVAALLVRLGGRGRRTWLAWSRVGWTAGCLVYLLHVVCAFAFYHHWSNAAAYDATAHTTKEVVGLDWGGGLYVNYVFTFVWIVDVCWWWLARESYAMRPRSVEWLVQGFMGFIAFNATVVFAAGFSRWMGIIACVLLIASLGVRKRWTER